MVTVCKGLYTSTFSHSQINGHIASRLSNQKLSQTMMPLRMLLHAFLINCLLTMLSTALTGHRFDTEGREMVVIAYTADPPILLP